MMTPKEFISSLGPGVIKPIKAIKNLLEKTDIGKAHQ
jgi:hypothetical protein